MFSKIIKWWKNEKFIDPPSNRAYIKITDIAKENGVYDDENKIIEVHRNGRIDKIKYTEADVESLREQGIPVISEEYSDDYEFINAEEFGSVTTWGR